MVIGAACVGKIMGTVIVATAWGMARQKAFVLGFLMNTKGLVELIVLNIGLAKGVCKPFLFVICDHHHHHNYCHGYSALNLFSNEMNVLYICLHSAISKSMFWSL